MRTVNVTNRETRIIDLMLKGICTAPHAERQQVFKQAYYKAIEYGLTGYALLARGFDLLIAEKYHHFDEALWENIENHQFGGGAMGQQLTYYQLRPLLFAHIHRRKANRLITKANSNLYDKYVESIQDSLYKADEYYRMVTDNSRKRTPKIQAVGWHGYAKLLLLNVQYIMKQQSNQEVKCCISTQPQFLTATEYYKKSIDIASRENFDYAPPLNGLAWLNWLTYRDNRKVWKKNKRIEWLNKCVKLLDQSIEASARKYAPSILLKASALFWLEIESGQRGDIEKAAKLIKEAMHISPYDNMMQSVLEGFSHALREDINDRLISPQLFHQMRFNEPAKAIKNDLNKYLVKGKSACKPRSLNQLVVLRRWSSYTPLISNKNHETKGGGYLLQWEGKKLVIDPGIGFVQNLYEYGYRVQDIDAILITHQHIDHADDMETILSILKSCKSSLRSRPMFLLTESGIERWEKMILSALEIKQMNDVIELIQPDSNMRRHVDIGRMRIFPVPLYNHKDAIDEASSDTESGRSPTGCGVVIRLSRKSGKDYVVGITSDTGYIPQASSSNNNNSRISDYYHDCDTIVMHISTVDDTLKPQKKVRKFLKHKDKWGASYGYPGRVYKKHLGFWGVTFFIRDLINKTKRSDRTIFLSEFGEETLKSRVAILNELCHIIESLGCKGKEQAKNIHISDIGTQIKLPKGTIGCNFGYNSCSNDADYFLDFDIASGDLNLPHRDWNDRALVHLCKEHDFLLGASTFALNPMIWEYSGSPVINDDIREARERKEGQLGPCIGNYWVNS